MFNFSKSNESFSISEYPEKNTTPIKTTNNIEPINTDQMKELIRQKNSNEFEDIVESNPDNINFERIITPEEISSRDIIEYSIHTRITYMVQQAQKVFLSKNYSNTQELQEKINRIIMNFQDVPDGTYRITYSQNESQIKFFKEATNEIISRFNDFNEFIETAEMEQIIPKLRGFINIPYDKVDKVRFDKDTYPGALVVHILDKDTYSKALNDTSLGCYSTYFGEDKLEGHVFVVNDELHNGDTYEIIDTEKHEYFHLLYSMIEPLTIQESDKIIEKAISAKEEISASYDKKIEQLQKKILPYEKILQDNNDSIIPNTYKLYYNKILQEIIDTKETKAQMETIAYANIDSYEFLHIWNLYQTFKDEFFAYSNSNSIPSDFWDYIGDESEVDILEKESAGRAFLSELRGLKKILKIAFKRGHTPEELSYYIIGTRSVSQAQKFIYLHMQRAGTAH